MPYFAFKKSNSYNEWSPYLCTLIQTWLSSANTAHRPRLTLHIGKCLCDITTWSDSPPTDRNEVAIRSDWQGAFHLWRGKIFCVKISHQRSNFLSMHVLSWHILHNNRNGEIVSECFLVTNSRYTAFADNKCLNAVILWYRQIGPIVSCGYLYWKNNLFLIEWNQGY